MNFGPYPEIKLTPKMLELAWNLSKDLGKIKNSIEEGEGNFIGFCGELAYKQFFGLPIDDIHNTYDYDIEHNNLTFDVKAKKRSVFPKSHYEVSIADFNTKQNCDYYIFASVKVDKRNQMPQTAHLVGYYPKKFYKEKSMFKKFEEKDLKSENQFEFKADCWNMFFRDLMPVQNLKNLTVV